MKKQNGNNGSLAKVLTCLNWVIFVVFVLWGVSCILERVGFRFGGSRCSGSALSYVGCILTPPVWVTTFAAIAKALLFIGIPAAIVCLALSIIELKKAKNSKLLISLVFIFVGIALASLCYAIGIILRRSML